MNIERIKMDIDAARKLLQGETNEQSYRIEAVAYHVQQALPKDEQEYPELHRKFLYQ